MTSSISTQAGLPYSMSQNQLKLRILFYTVNNETRIFCRKEKLAAMIEAFKGHAEFHLTPKFNISTTNMSI